MSREKAKQTKRMDSPNPFKPHHNFGNSGLFVWYIWKRVDN